MKTPLSAVKIDDYEWAPCDANGVAIAGAPTYPTAAAAAWWRSRFLLGLEQLPPPVHILHPYQ